MNTLKMYSSASGAKPGHSALVPAMTPATKDPWPRPSAGVLLSVNQCKETERTANIYEGNAGVSTKLYSKQ